MSPTNGEVWYVVSKLFDGGRGVVPCIILDLTDRLVSVERVDELKWRGDCHFREMDPPFIYRMKIPMDRIVFIEKARRQVVYCLDRRVLSWIRKDPNVLYKSDGFPA